MNYDQLDKGIELRGDILKTKDQIESWQRSVQFKEKNFIGIRSDGIGTYLDSVNIPFNRVKQIALRKLRIKLRRLENEFNQL